MKTRFATSLIVLGSIFAPFAAHAADGDRDKLLSRDFVKDSVITTKIKARLAEEKLSSTMRISVDTDNKGVVQMTGTAKTQTEIDRAGVIAKNTEGVTSVENKIRLSSSAAARDGRTGERTQDQRGNGRTAERTQDQRGNGMAGERMQDQRGNAMVGDTVGRVEARIKDMHTRLMITQAQEDQWSKVAQVMRDNAKQMDALAKTRAERAAMSAVQDLKSYGEISEAHADGIKKVTPVFSTLYDSMSAKQKKAADGVFRNGSRKMT